MKNSGSVGVSVSKKHFQWSSSGNGGLAMEKVMLIFGRVKEKQPGGFALIASILALFILTALGLLTFTVSTRDVRISSRVVGEKKAFTAAETGIHYLTSHFIPENLAATSWQVVDINTDPNSRFAIAAAARPTTGPATIPMSGYSIGGGQVWGQERFNTMVTGENTGYGSTVSVDVGLGFGPVEITTAYR